MVRKRKDDEFSVCVVTEKKTSRRNQGRSQGRDHEVSAEKKKKKKKRGRGGGGGSSNTCGWTGYTERRIIIGATAPALPAEPKFKITRHSK